MQVSERGLALLALGTLGAAAATACFRPGEDFDEFNARCQKADGSVCNRSVVDPFADGGCQLPAAQDVLGTFFLALSSGLPGSEQFPTLQLVRVTEAEAEGGGIRVEYTIRALSACDPTAFAEGSTERQRSAFVEPDGALLLDLGETTLPADANPLVPVDVTSHVTLETRACAGRMDALCGIVSEGVIKAPIMQTLDDGTFAMRRVADVGEVPATVVIDCGATPALLDQYPACQ